MSSSGDSIQGLLFLLGGGAMFVYRGLKAHKKLRSVQDTARSKLETAPQGLAEFEGFAWPQEKRFELFGGDHAVYYSASLQVEKTEGSGKNKRKVWRTVDSFSFFEPFFLLDPTGVAMIKANDVDWHLDSQVTRLWKSIKPDEQFHFLEKIFTGGASGFPPGSGLTGLFSQKFRVVESMIRVGCPLYVKGDFHTKAGNAEQIKAPGLSDFFDKVMNPDARSLKDVSARLDDNKDGKISANEAKKGYAFAARLAIKNAAIGAKEEREFPVHGEIRSSEAHKMMIADCHEEHLVQRMSRSFKLQLGGGAVMLILGLTLALHTYVFKSSRSNSARTAAVVTKNDDRGPAMQKAVVVLHQECYAGNPRSCRSLIDKAKPLGLTDQYVEGYKKQACRLGENPFCADGRSPASK